MTSCEIVKALREKYALPKWASFDELRDGTGAAAKRAIDFWAMNCYPSNGFLTVAIEIKVSRGDFIRELNTPVKRESAESSARETYFAAPAGMIKPAECPEGWGLIEVHPDGSTRTKVRAKQREKPVFKDAFIASLMRRVAEADRDVKRLQVHVTEATVAAKDIQGYLATKEREHFEAQRPFYERRFKDEAIAEIMGEGYGQVIALARREFGHYAASRSLSQCIIDLVHRAASGTLEKAATDDIRLNVAKGIEALTKISDALGSVSTLSGNGGRV